MGRGPAHGGSARVTVTRLPPTLPTYLPRSDFLRLYAPTNTNSLSEVGKVKGRKTQDFLRVTSHPSLIGSDRNNTRAISAAGFYGMNSAAARGTTRTRALPGFRRIGVRVNESTLRSSMGRLRCVGEFGSARRLCVPGARRRARSPIARVAHRPRNG